jgi:hypothetical protein
LTIVTNWDTFHGIAVELDVPRESMPLNDVFLAFKKKKKKKKQQKAQERSP